MVLPTNLGFNTSTNGYRMFLGPYKSSAGNFYAMGGDVTTQSTLRVKKTSDPSSSWSDSTTVTDWFASNEYNGFAGVQVGDTIHIALSCTPPLATPGWVKYATFDMSSDTFPINETVISSMEGALGVFWVDITYRTSDNQPIIFHNGPYGTSMGNDYNRVYYSRRTGTDTWVVNQAVDAGGAVQYSVPSSISGSSNRSHLLWIGGAYSTGYGNIYHRTLASNNSLLTQTAIPYSVDLNLYGARSFDVSGTIKVVVSTGNTSSYFVPITFDSADVPTITVQSTTVNTFYSNWDISIDDTDVWFLGQSIQDDDVKVRKSTDYGATFESLIVQRAYDSTTDLHYITSSGLSYVRGSNTVYAYLARKPSPASHIYDEYTISTSEEPTDIGLTTALPVGPPYF